VAFSLFFWYLVLFFLLYVSFPPALGPFLTPPGTHSFLLTNPLLLFQARLIPAFFILHLVFPLRSLAFLIVQLVPPPVWSLTPARLASLGLGGLSLLFFFFFFFSAVFPKTSFLFFHLIYTPCYYHSFSFFDKQKKNRPLLMFLFFPSAFLCYFCYKQSDFLIFSLPFFSGKFNRFFMLVLLVDLSTFFLFPPPFAVLNPFGSPFPLFLISPFPSWCFPMDRTSSVVFHEKQLAGGSLGTVRSDPPPLLDQPLVFPHQICSSLYGPPDKTQAPNPTRFIRFIYNTRINNFFFRNPFSKIPPFIFPDWPRS